MKPASPSLVVSQRELAAVLRVSPKRVQQWDRDGLAETARLGMDGRSAQYDLSAAVFWWHDRRIAAIERASSADVMDAARLRKLEAEAGSKELDLAVKRSELVPIDEVEDLLRESLESIDSVLRHSPSRFAPNLSKVAKIPLKRARTILEDMVELVRGSVRDGRKGA